MASVMFPVDLAYLVDAGGPDRHLPALYAAHHLWRHRVVLVVLHMRQKFYISYYDIKRTRLPLAEFCASVKFTKIFFNY